MKIQNVLSVDDAIATFDNIEPVKPRRVALYEAIGQRVVEDVLARTPSKLRPVAAMDGWAVRAEETAGASKRQPRSLKTAPLAIDCCQALPAGTDAVLGAGSILKRARSTAALEEVAPGTNVLSIAEQIHERTVLLEAGSRMNLAAALAAGLNGVNDVMIRRPVVDIILNSPVETAPGTQFVRMIAAAIRTSGSEIGAVSFANGDPAELKRALLDSSADTICTIGGTGSGPGDCTMDTLAEVGRVFVRGVRLKPGSSFGFAIVEGKPVFASPGGLADMLAANIVFSTAFARRVFGRPYAAPPVQEARLAEPIPAPGDTSQVVLGLVHEDKFVPIFKERLTPLEIAKAQAVVFMPEGARHKRAGEMVAYTRLGIGI